MVKHYTNFNIKKIHRGSIILIGNFDGLHLGHQKLFQLAQSYKKKYSLMVPHISGLILTGIQLIGVVQSYNCKDFISCL